MVMGDVTLAWLMASLQRDPFLVALVQSAVSLPVFLLGLPFGALADLLDRRRCVVLTQLWVAAGAVFLALLVWSGSTTPTLLLLLAFINGIGIAMRWPVLAAMVPDCADRDALPQAIALNSLAMNVARLGGPLLAGAIIAHAGAAWVFVLNAVLSLACALAALGFSTAGNHTARAPTGNAQYTAQCPPKTLPAHRGTLCEAMADGLRFMSSSLSMRVALSRAFVLFFHSGALLGLLPLAAPALDGGPVTAYPCLLAALGAGAIGTALLLPRLRASVSPTRIVLLGAGLQSAATLGVALGGHLYLTLVAMAMAGAGWLAAFNTLTVIIQDSLPNWVRARGMSIYQMALMAGNASGAALAGQVARLSGVPVCLLLAALSGCCVMALLQWKLPSTTGTR